MGGNSIFGFSGRVNRARYWLFALIAVPTVVALYIAYYAYAMSFPGAYENGGPTPWPSTPATIAAAAVWWLVLAALVLAWAALTVRRLHDRDRSWWWLLAFFAAPNWLDVINRLWLRTYFDLGPALTLIITSAAFMMNAWGVVEVAFLPGTAGDNRYGPDPRAPKP